MIGGNIRSVASQYYQCCVAIIIKVGQNLSCLIENLFGVELFILNKILNNIASLKLIPGGGLHLLP